MNRKPKTDRRCSGPCGQVLPLDEFYPHAANPLGRSYVCKACNTHNVRKNAFKREYRTNPEKFKARIERATELLGLMYDVMNEVDAQNRET